MIITGVLLVAILIAGWAFFRDQRLKDLAPLPEAGNQAAVTGIEPSAALGDANSDIDAELQSIDAELKQLDEDNTNIDDTMDQTGNTDDTNQIK